jgi:hypothetical protein
MDPKVQSRVYATGFGLGYDEKHAHGHHLYNVVSQVLDPGKDVVRELLVSPDSRLRCRDPDYGQEKKSVPRGGYQMG